MSDAYDLIIVGGGIAGLCAALAAPEGSRIVVIDKGEASAGSSPLAQGGMAAAVGPEDSPELHAKDTIAAGAGICDEQVVEDICTEGPSATRWLLELGCDFDRDERGDLHLAREGGQSVARSVHWRDATGQEIVRALRAAVRERNVERVRARVSRLVVAEGRCAGVIADGRAYRARATLLATGGAGSLWGATTNASGATADGLVLALAAGATVADLEFMQFHPTALAVAGTQMPLLTEALRGHGATLVDADGDRFVDELAPRHIVAKAILDRRGAFLDCRSIDRFDELFPTVAAAARAHGFDPLGEALPVTPAAHYFIGGIAADAHGATTIPGLFAAGECASTGMHGANRMAGNSLLETVVVGRRVGARVATEPHPPETRDADPESVEEDGFDARIPEIMWRGVGPIRSGDALARALDELTQMSSAGAGGEAAVGHVGLCVMIARAALRREETRGVHIRSDFPDAEAQRAARSFDRAEPFARAPGQVRDLPLDGTRR